MEIQPVHSEDQPWDFFGRNDAEAETPVLATSCEELTPWKESFDQPIWHVQKQRHYFANKGPSSQGYGFSTGLVWMSELDCEEG